MRLVVFASLAVLTACASSPPPADPAPPPPTKSKRPPRRPGFGGGGAGKAELKAAIDAAKKNDFDTTIEKCKAAIAKNPNLEQAHLLLGSACSMKDDAKCERMAYEEGVKSLPASLALRSELGFLELQQGKYDAAIAQYEKANEIAGGKNADVVAHMGYAHGLAGRADKGLELAGKATSMNEKCGRCAAIHGQLLLATKQLDDAVKMLERAYSLAKDDVDAAHQLAKAYFLSKKLDKAIELYDALVKGTGDPGLRSEYAIALSKANRHKEAVEQLKVLTEQFPDEPTLKERLRKAKKKARKSK